MENPKANWYALQVRAGSESKVADEIKKIRAKNEDSFLEEVLLPVSNLYNDVSDQDKKKIKKQVSGYLFVKMVNSEENFRSLRNVPHVGRFLTTAAKSDPAIITEQHIQEMKASLESQALTSSGPISLGVGDKIKVIDGPFESFTGNIQSIDKDKKRIVACIFIFGISTSVELNSDQVSIIEE